MFQRSTSRCRHTQKVSEEDFNNPEITSRTDRLDDMRLKTNNTAITVEWLRDNLDKQALANGLCCLPCQVKCPHTNSCIHCNNFVTTIDYLDIHKKQLELLEGNLELYKANSYVSNIATTEKDIEKLRDIIHRLEEEQ